MTWTAPKRNITAFGLAILIWGRAIRGFAGEICREKDEFLFLAAEYKRVQDLASGSLGDAYHLHHFAEQEHSS